MYEKNTARENELFEQLAESWSDTVTRICWVHLKHLSDAEDAYQNVFMKLYRARNMWEKPPRELEKWLVTVALNECRDMKRRLFHRSHESIDEVTVACDEDFDTGIIDRIKELPVKYSQPI